MITHTRHEVVTGQRVAPAATVTLPRRQVAAAASSLRSIAMAQRRDPLLEPTSEPALISDAGRSRSRSPDCRSTISTARKPFAADEEELNDESKEKCFAIQLAVSEQPVNLDAMPHLDIFEAYRLYSIATAGSGKITHSLRIGFFSEEVSAEAVSGYLRTFFPTPSIVRISLAEQALRDPSPRRQPAPTASDRQCCCTRGHQSPRV